MIEPHLNPLRRGIELFILKDGKYTQSTSFKALPLASNMELSSKIYRSEDLSEPDLKSTMLSWSPVNVIFISFEDHCRRNYTCGGNHCEANAISSIMETIFLRPNKVEPKHTGTNAKVRILSGLPVKKSFKLGWILLQLFRHKDSFDTLVLALVVAGQPHIPLESQWGIERA